MTQENGKKLSNQLRAALEAPPTKQIGKLAEPAYMKVRRMVTVDRPIPGAKVARFLLAECLASVASAKPHERRGWIETSLKVIEMESKIVGRAGGGSSDQPDDDDLAEFEEILKEADATQDK